MFAKFFKNRKLLLTAGLLIILAQGLWELPLLQSYLYPVKPMRLILRSARREFNKMELDLGGLTARVAYLNWINAAPGRSPSFSRRWLLTFPLSECLRPLFPGYLRQANLFLAKKNRAKVERKLRYLDAFLNNVDAMVAGMCPAGAALSAQKATAPIREKVQQFHRRLTASLTELQSSTRQLTRLAHEP
jgi:hypothetical protein